MTMLVEQTPERIRTVAVMLSAAHWRGKLSAVDGFKDEDREESKVIEIMAKRDAYRREDSARALLNML
jgi:hypothetical protein